MRVERRARPLPILLRVDHAAAVLTIASGLLALATMWAADRRAIYLGAALLYAAVGALVTWQLVRRPALSRPAAIAVRGAKAAACVALAAGCVLSGSFAAFRPGLHPASKAVAIGALLVVVQLGQLSSVASRRDLALGAPVACAMVTQAAMVASDASLAVPFGLCLAAMVASVALAHRGELLAEARAVCAVPGSPRRSRILGRAVWPVLWRVAVIAAALFVVLPNSSQLGVQASPSAAAHAPDGGERGGGPSLDPGPRSQAIADPGSGVLDLRVRGQLGEAPVFVVDAAAPPYWQGAVFDRYDGVRWSVSGGSPTRWRVGDPPSPGAPALQSAPAPPTDLPAVTRVDSVQIVTTTPQHVVFAPGRATAYLGPGRVSSDFDGNVRLDGVPAGKPSSRDYAVTSSRAPQASSAMLSKTTTSPGAAGDNPGADPRWTQLPDQLPQRVRTLASQLWDQAGGSRPAMVERVDAYLRANEVYDLSSPLPAAGYDAVDDFLFISHRGFCEQFATAAVVLLRAVGIPARLVTGYSQGDVKSEPGKRIMRSSDAHAWIEVWYSGIGWISADPTASTTLSQNAGGPVGVSAASPSSSGHQSSSHSSSSSSASHSSSSSSASQSSSSSASSSVSSPAAPSPSASSIATPRAELLGRSLWRFPAWRLAIVAGVLAVGITARGLLVLWLGRGRRRSLLATRTSSAFHRAAGPLLQAYSRLDDALTAAGRPLAPGDTARELLSRLDGIAMISPAVVETAVVLLERECYGVEPLPASDLAVGLEAFEALTRAVRKMPVVVH